MKIHRILLVFLFQCIKFGFSSHIRSEPLNPWSSEHVKLQAQNCVVTASARVDCGYTGITQSECSTNGCCWAPATTAPWCYYSASYAPTVHPTVSPTPAPSTHTPTAKPTAPIPTALPTTSAPSYSLSPTHNHTATPSHFPTIAPTNQAATSGNAASEAIVIGCIVGFIALIGGAFVLYVFYNIYEKPAAVKETPEPPSAPMTMMEQLKALNSNLTVRMSRDDMSIYSMYSKGNQSQITEVQFPRNNRDEEFEMGRTDPGERDTDDSSTHFEGVFDGGPIRWYEGRDHGFVTP